MTDDPSMCAATLVVMDRCDKSEGMYRIEVEMPDKLWVLYVCNNTNHQGIVFHGVATNANGNPMTVTQTKEEK